ncbi:MAG: hypothetical protein ACO215_11135, partial [Vulcanococcus sp.]
MAREIKVRTSFDVFDALGLRRFRVKESRRFPGENNTFVLHSRTRKAQVKLVGSGDLVLIEGERSDFEIVETTRSLRLIRRNHAGKVVQKFDVRLSGVSKSDNPEAQLYFGETGYRLSRSNARAEHRLERLAADSSPRVRRATVDGAALQGLDGTDVFVVVGEINDADADSYRNLDLSAIRNRDDLSDQNTYDIRRRVKKADLVRSGESKDLKILRSIKTGDSAISSDVLVIFGDVDLSGVEIDPLLRNVIVNSTLVLTYEQLLQFKSITSGNMHKGSKVDSRDGRVPQPSTLVIIGSGQLDLRNIDLTGLDFVLVDNRQRDAKGNLVLDGSGNAVRLEASLLLPPDRPDQDVLVKAVAGSVVDLRAAVEDLTANRINAVKLDATAPIPASTPAPIPATRSSLGGGGGSPVDRTPPGTPGALTDYADD